MIKFKKTVCGVGVNDADYPVQPRINGKVVVCPYYRAWVNMLARCYDHKFQAKRPTYAGCEVVPEWHSFMAFKTWMVGQDWQDMQMDKDTLVPGNKIYGPLTCVFVTAKLNSFTLDHAAGRGEFPIGVCWDKAKGNFKASCRNPFTGKYDHLGYFTCPDEAHEAWRKRKHEIALELAAQQTDPRLANALATRYLKGQSK